MVQKLVKMAILLALCLALCCPAASAAGLCVTSQFGYGNTCSTYSSYSAYPTYSQSNPCPTSNGYTVSNGNCYTNANCYTSSACCTASTCDRCSVCLACGCSICPNKSCSKPNPSQPTVPVKDEPESPAVDGHYTIGAPSAQEKEEWNYINADRQRQGLPALTLDPALCALARMKSTDMLTKRYFAHTSPTYGSAKDMLKTYGYAFTGVGENISKHATVVKSHAALMSSSGHRANILGRAWTKVGIGIALDSNGYVYMTQLFVR